MTNRWEKEFIAAECDSYCIYQLITDTEGAVMRRFMSYDWLIDHDMKPEHNDYEAVYYEKISDCFINQTAADELLEQIYMRFNMGRPKDFTGWSVSVSDVIAIKRRGGIKYYYTDSVGFIELHDFVEEK